MNQELLIWLFTEDDLTENHFLVQVILVLNVKGAGWEIKVSSNIIMKIEFEPFRETPKIQNN